jgi:hypothetical protein
MIVEPVKEEKMDNKEEIVEKILNLFEGNIGDFRKIVSEGSLTALLSYIFIKTMVDLNIEERRTFVQNFIHSLASTLTFMFFPLSEDSKLEANLIGFRKNMFENILLSLAYSNKIDEKDITNIEGIPTTIH